jgi:antitoxin component YwqK of YwqJK toxin-antitoxin module
MISTYELLNAHKTVIKKISDKKVLIKRYWSNGQLKFKGSYYVMPNELVDKENGTEITLKKYETNGIKGYANFSMRDGVRSWWYKNGQKKQEEHYKNGKIDGIYTFWDENGRIKSKVNFKSGKKNGKAIWFFDNGQIDRELNYKDGKKIRSLNV